MEASVEAFSSVMHAIENVHTEFMEEIKERHSDEQTRFDLVLGQLREEIAALEKKSVTLDELTQSQDYFSVLHEYEDICTLPPTQHWPDIPVFELDFFGDVRASLSKARDIINTEMRNQSATELKKVQLFAEDITIDPETAGPWLIVSEDGKEVRQSPKKQKVPASPARFTENLFALATQPLSTGRHYWEVAEHDKPNWLLGVARGAVKRGERYTASPDKGLWAVGLVDGRQFVAYDQKPLPVSLPLRPQRVGVFVDHEHGQVTFFNAAAKTHIFTFAKCRFSDTIYALFDPCLAADKKDSAPLQIRTVEIAK